MRKKEKPERKIQWLKLSIFILLFISLFLVYSHKAILHSVASFLIVEDPLQQSDLLIVLGGDRWERAREGVDIYKKGYAKKILIMKELTKKEDIELLKLGIVVDRTHETSRKVMIALGVPEGVIKIPEKEANSTYQEALIAKEIIKEQRIKSIIIVTGKTHTRRACMTFKLILGRDTHVIRRPTKHDDFELEGWWLKRENIKEVIIEYQKLIFYFFSLLKYRIKG